MTWIADLHSANNAVPCVPAACITFKNLGPGFGKEQVAVGGTSTIKVKRDKFASSLAFSDQTLRSAKTLKVGLTAATRDAIMQRF